MTTRLRKLPFCGGWASPRQAHVRVRPVLLASAGDSGARGTPGM